MKKILSLALILFVTICFASCAYEKEAVQNYTGNENIKQNGNMTFEVEASYVDGENKLIISGSIVGDDATESELEQVPVVMEEANDKTVTPILIICLVLLILAALVFWDAVLIAAVVVIVIVIVKKKRKNVKEEEKNEDLK